MKLSITDKFLWDVYGVINKTTSVLGALTNRTAFYNFSRGDMDPIFEKYRKEKGAKKFAKLIYYLKTRGYIRVKNL